MNTITEWTLNNFLEKAAGPDPTPGGGSAAACSGALAAAMVSMAAQLTAGKEGCEEAWIQAEDITRQATLCLQQLKEGIQQDIDVFNAYMDALRLPKTTETEKQERTHHLQKASRNATQSPLTIAENALKVINLACHLAPLCNKNVVSDVGVAAAMALGAFNAALWSVKINLVSMPDNDFTTHVRTQCTQWQQEADRRGTEAASLVEQRISGV